MKPVVLKFITPLAFIALTPLALWAQVTLPTSANPPVAGEAAPVTAADRAWEAVQAENKAAEADLSGPGSRGRSRAETAARGKAAAERARKFYTEHPEHPLAGEARKLEVFAMIQTLENGDLSDAKRLDGLVDTLRKDPAAPVKTRAQVAAAYEFTKALRPLKAEGDRMDATVTVARQLAQEFPGEPQAYEALLAVARSCPRAKAEKIARELLDAPAPETLKAAAQTLLDRHGLVDRRLVEVLGETGSDLAAALPPATPVIVYSWATWGPGSLELGRMIQARRFAALGVCLDENTVEAAQAEHQAGLGGKHVYDPKGPAGVLAGRLKFSTAGQIYLVDSSGVIRDVRGGDGLEAKLKALGFSTPALVVPSITELLRQ